MQGTRSDIELWAHTIHRELGSQRQHPGTTQPTLHVQSVCWYATPTQHRSHHYTGVANWEVHGYVMLEQDKRVRFTGRWNRQGTIEAVDSDGKMYMFDVVTVLNGE